MSILDVSSALVMGFVVISAARQMPSAQMAPMIDARAAAQGRAVFEGQARCASCHALPEDAQTVPDAIPLRDLAGKQRVGLYHDHRFRSLYALVNHYDTQLGLHLTPEQKRQLVEYLKSL